MITTGRGRRGTQWLGGGVGGLVVAAVMATAAPAGARITVNTIASTATLAAHGYLARGDVLIACTEGQFVLFTLTLAQGDAAGTAYGAGRCTGELTAYPVMVPARSGVFAPGNAAACASADNYNLRGEVEDSLRWCPAGGVTLVSA
jgi:hypothetical protein